MSPKEFNDKWEEGSNILSELGAYLMSEAGISDYGNAVKILTLIEKFEIIQSEYKKMLTEAKIDKSTDDITVPNFSKVEKYVAEIKKSAIQVKNVFC